jgi:hypothetical protein
MIFKFLLGLVELDQVISSVGAQFLRDDFN